MTRPLAQCRDLLASAKAQTETQIIRAILDYLAANRIMAWRNNTGAMKNPAGRLVRFGVKGMPDIAGVMPGGRAVFVEVKRPGKQPTDAQARMLTRLRQQGAIAELASSIDDIRGWLGLHSVSAL